VFLNMCVSVVVGSVADVQSGFSAGMPCWYRADPVRGLDRATGDSTASDVPLSGDFVA
jgi:hypothetical protein